MVVVFQILLSIFVMAHPLIQIESSSTTPLQGDAVWVYVKSSKKLSSGSVELNKKSFKMFEKKAEQSDRYDYLTCIGISRYLSPKKYQLKFNLNYTDGSAYQTHQTITVKSANFKKEHITLKPKKLKLSQDKPKIRNENSILGKQFKKVTAKKRFNDSFLWPVEGRHTSEFGVQRVYNNKPGWAHSGVDISAVKGTPIKASHAGTVIFADLLNVHGNTVMIDHGWGIVTVYNHLNKINVKTNDNLSKGDLIGTVGSTGIATGDHLHFGVSVQNIRINPTTWVNSISNSIP